MHPCQGLVFQCADEVGFGLLSFEVEKFLVPRSALRSLQPSKCLCAMGSLRYSSAVQFIVSNGKIVIQKNKSLTRVRCLYVP